MKFKGRPSGGDRSPKAGEEPSPDALAKELANLQMAQAELTRTIDRLAGQIDSLQTGDPQAAPSPVAPSESPTKSAAADPPPPPPPGFAVRAGSSTASAPPPPQIRDIRPSSPPPPPPPPAGTQTELSPLDRLLGEDFGKPRVHASTEPQSPPITPNFAASDASAEESPAPVVSQPIFHVSPVLREHEPATSTDEESPASREGLAESPTPTTTKPAAPFSFNATLDQLTADEPGKNGQVNPAPSPSPAPAPTAKVSVPETSENPVGALAVDEDKDVETPAADFFRSGGQSFASAAAMVNDILAATPDAAGPESGQPEGEQQASRAADEPSAPEVPITPDFFTAQPKKRFRLRR